MMKTPEEIIQETIDMIDEYEARIDEMNRKERINLRHSIIYGIILLVVAGSLIVYFLFA